MSGQQLYPTPRESPGRYRPRPLLNREIKRSISQYDHAELVSLSAMICSRIPVLRAAIRDKNAWAFANWLPVYMGEDEAWGEAVEEWLIHEVLPNAVFRELRKDFAWGMRISGMGLDMHGDDLCIFTEDEQHNPKIDFVAAPRIGSGLVGQGWTASMFSGTFATARSDGQGIVDFGQYKGLPIYNGVIRRNGFPVAIRILGYDDFGNPSFSDLPIGDATGTHYACEMEFFGQGRGVPRPSASVLHWMNKEDIDDQFLKGLKNAAERTVIHKLPPGQDVSMARGNAVLEIPVCDPSDDPNCPTEEKKSILVERSQDGTVTYIGSDEELAGLAYENPHPNGEAFAIRVLRECLADLGWSWSLIDTSTTSRAPTRLETTKANNSIADRQSIEEIRTVKFLQYAVGMGMKNGKIPKNNAGMDAYKWAIGFPAQMSVDEGNDVTSALNRLRMGLTTERIEAAKEGLISKQVRRQRLKEVKELVNDSDAVYKMAQGLGHTTFSFDQAMQLLYQPNPNGTAMPEMPEVESTEPAVGATAQPAKKK